LRELNLKDQAATSLLEQLILTDDKAFIQALFEYYAGEFYILML